MVDVGEPLDQSLIEALSREVLKEKISSMIANKQLFPDEVIINSYNQKNVQKNQQLQQQPPVPSPRKLIEYLNQADKLEPIDVPTPIPTPSLPNSPRETNRPIMIEEAVQVLASSGESSPLEETIKGDDGNFA
jgi:hypothetical protein